MKQYAEIKGIEYSLGSVKLDAFEIGKRFIAKDNPKERIEHFIKDVLGKSTLYRFDEDVVPVDFGAEVAKRLLSRLDISPEDIDMIICTSAVPEYYMPAEAVEVHYKIGLRSDVKYAADFNSSCTGFVSALYNVNAIMSIDPEVNNVLVLDIMTLAHFVPHDDIVANASFSDAAVAVVIGRRQQPVEGLFFNSYQDSSQVDSLKGPGFGAVSLTRTKDITAYEVRCTSMLDCKMDKMVEHAKAFINKNHVDISQIKNFCFSQYVRQNIDILRDGLKISDEYIPYVGRNIGYTGPSSPFVALKKQIDEGKIDRGDKILFWTVATGLQHVIMTFQY